MAMTVAFDNGLSGLHANQQALSATAHNIANVNTPGYHKMVPTMRSVVTGGVGTGVSVTNVRVDDAALTKQSNQINSRVGQYDTAQGYFQSIDVLYGKPGANANNVSSSANSLTVTIANFRAEMNNLATSPAGLPPQSVVAKGQLLAQNLNNMSQQIQLLRQQADQQVQEGLTFVNTQIDNISQLNGQISQGIVSNLDVGDLQDQRDQAVKAISEYMDVNTYVTSNGEMVVSTGTGRVMVDVNGYKSKFGQIGTAPSYTLTSYTAAATFTAATTTNQIGLGQMGKNGNPDLTTELRAGSGRISALLNQRGEYSSTATLPAGQLQNRTSELNQLCNQLFTSVQATNLATTNNGTAVFPTFPAAYTDANHFFEGVDTTNTPPNLDNAATIAVHRQIVANANLLTLTNGTGTVDPTISSNLAATLNSSTVAFTASGSLSAYTGTFSGWASAIESNVARSSANATTALTYNQALQESVNYRIGQSSGVNLDDELSRMIQLQQAYQASAKVINTADQMLQTLMTLKQ